nr:FAD-binding oxidoreductase [Alteraurantiacibacter aestuarii]
MARVVDAQRSVIPFGLGRSYGDVALNEGGTVLQTPRLDALIHADWNTGIVRAEAGLSLAMLHKVSVQRGYFVAVTPGTKFVTLGGAVANDVHGKNHHQAGSFGAHVRALGLLRSDGTRLTCSREQNGEMFALTIGGLGLTGLIEWVELQLKPIGSAFLTVENMACTSLDEFFTLSHDSADWPYTVMWVDCFAKGKAVGRGIFSRGRVLDDGALEPHGDKGLSMPMTMPAFVLNKASITAFNRLYRMRPGARFAGRQHYDPFFYPLDAIDGWNKLYGPSGFYQHQCLIPPDEARKGIREMLEIVEQAGQGSFLAVLKVHGPETSPGVMSFCREGVSLALDFANKGERTLRLLDQLDQCVARHGGRIYPAKDGRMAAAFYQQSYPRWRELEEARDPAFSSSFWRRVTQEQGANS